MLFKAFRYKEIVNRFQRAMALYETFEAILLIKTFE